MPRHTDKDPGGQKDRQTSGPCSNQEQHPSCSPCVVRIRNEVRFCQIHPSACFISLSSRSSAALCVIPHAYFSLFLLLLFFVLFLSCFRLGFLPSFVPVMCADVSGHCASAAWWRPSCVPCLCWCMQIGLFGAGGSCKHFVCGITSMW